MPSREQLTTMLGRIRALPYGQSRTAAAERVVADVEASDHDDLLPQAYSALAIAYRLGPEGEEDKAFVPFSKALHLYDRHAELFTDVACTRLLWQFTWILSTMRADPAVPLGHIERVLADMRRLRRGWRQYERRAPRRVVMGMAPRRLGDGRRAPCGLPGDTARRVDHLRGVRPQQRRCLPCAAHRLEKGLAELRRATTGVDACGGERSFVLGRMLDPLTKTGRLDEARDAHIAGLPVVRGDRSKLTQLGFHLEFLARTGNAGRGLDLVVEHLTLLDDLRDPPIAARPSPTRSRCSTGSSPTVVATCGCPRP
jgi:hypothetical protein